MSPLQYKIYQFIKSFLTEHGHSPTLLEIAKGVGISPRSKGLVSRYVHSLVKSGKLAFDHKGYRNIHLPPLPKIQLAVEGEISAGCPAELLNKHEVLDLSDILEDDNYILVVKGNLLIHEGILDGDKLICKRQVNPKDGALAIVTVDAQPATVKRIYYLNDKTIELKTTNPTSNSLTYLCEQVNIQGIVTGVLRLLK